MSSKTASIAVSDETNLRVSIKTLCAIGMIISAAVWAWASIKGEVSGHTKKLEEVSAQFGIIESKVSEHEKLLIRMDSKLDYLTGNRHGDRPPTSSPASGTQ